MISRRDAIVFLFFVALAIVVDGALLVSYRRDVRGQLSQIQAITRGPIVGGDGATAREYMSALTPEFVVDFEIAERRDPRLDAQFEERVEIFYDTDGENVAGFVYVNLDRRFFYLSMLSVNGLLVALTLGGVVYSRTRTWPVAKTEDSH
jgi:hypothetical protein